MHDSIEILIILVISLLKFYDRGHERLSNVFNENVSVRIVNAYRRNLNRSKTIWLLGAVRLSIVNLKGRLSNPLINWSVWISRAIMKRHFSVSESVFFGMQGLLKLRKFFIVLFLFSLHFSLLFLVDVHFVHKGALLMCENCFDFVLLSFDLEPRFLFGELLYFLQIILGHFFLFTSHLGDSLMFLLR